MTINTTGMPATDGSAYLTLTETADELRVSLRTVRRIIAAGHLPAFRLAGHRGVRVRRADLDQAVRPIPSAAVAHDRRVMS